MHFIVFIRNANIRVGLFCCAAAAASIAEDTTKRKRQKIRPKKAIMNGIKGPNDKTARTPSHTEDGHKNNKAFACWALLYAGSSLRVFASFPLIFFELNGSVHMAFYW